MIIIFDLKKDCKPGTTLAQAGTGYLKTESHRRAAAHADAVLIQDGWAARLIKCRGKNSLFGQQASISIHLQVLDVIAGTANTPASEREPSNSHGLEHGE